MIIGFKGESSKLKDLYKKLGLKEVKPNTFEELEEAIKGNDGKTIILNYNEIMVFEEPTADKLEKRTEVLKAVGKSKKDIFLSLTKNDASVDKLSIDYSVCTKVNTKDMKLIEELYNFCNTDLPYSGKLNDDEYAVKSKSDYRAEAKSLSELTKLLNIN